jgi:hypothetical protein
MTNKFELGKHVISGDLMKWAAENNTYIALIACWQRHAEGDWGDVSEFDASENDRDVECGGLLLSAYEIKGRRILILTEADRSLTTIMFNDEY